MFWAHDSNLSYFKKKYSVSHTITLYNAVYVCIVMYPITILVAQMVKNLPVCMCAQSYPTV